MEELKRCPFCGAEQPTVKVIHPLNVDMASWVVCGKCGVSTSVTFGKKKPSKHGTNATKRIEYGAGTQA
jgi:transcription elongation factor Elf1